MCICVCMCMRIAHVATASATITCCINKQDFSSFFPFVLSRENAERKKYLKSSKYLFAVDINNIFILI